MYSKYEGKSIAYKNKLLFQMGVNYSDLPSWQKRGIGVYHQDVTKEGDNPVKDEKVMTQRKELVADYELPFGNEYRELTLRFLEVEE